MMIFAFTACNDDDGYSLNDQWIGFGVLKGDGESAYQIVMDNGDELVTLASNYPGWWEDFDNGDRVLLNFTILDEELNDDGSVDVYYVKLNDIDDILMKGVLDITPEIEDSIGNDPIVVDKYWMTDSLLNFRLKYRGYSATHFLNLVKEPGEITEADQPIQLELRHNANNDDEAIPYTAYVSFSLNSLRINELDSVQFQFTSTDYDGVEHVVTETFNYEDLELPVQ
jgi:hypothetical protein